MSPAFKSLEEAKQFASSPAPKIKDAQVYLGVFYFLCWRRDLNPQDLRHTILSRTCIPIPPLQQKFTSSPIYLSTAVSVAEN